MVTLKNKLSAMYACHRPDVNNLICHIDDLFVMLYNDNRVSFVA